MKKTFNCLVIIALSLFASGWTIPAKAHPKETGKTCHVSEIFHDVISAYPLTVVGGDVIHPPDCATSNLYVNSGKSGFDQAMLPGYYVELRLYSWYVPLTIGDPITKSEGSILWQSKLLMRTDHDKL